MNHLSVKQSRRRSVEHVIEALQPRRLLAGTPLPLNPVNPRPISDPTFFTNPVPRLNITARKTLVITAEHTPDMSVLQ